MITGKAGLLQARFFLDYEDIHLKYLIPVLLLLSLTACQVPKPLQLSPAAHWHDKDMDLFITEQYPIGSDVEKLISDFTAHGYTLSTDKDRKQGSLDYKARCWILFGRWPGRSIVWQANAEGKITYIKNWGKMCLFTP